MVENRQFSKREDFFQTVFEIARRHKIMNPEKMRTSYCKLMYMLQDARSEKIKSLLEFDVFCPLTTVYSVLKSAGAESLLSDPLMAVATMECPDDKSKTRYQLNERIRTKQKAIRKLSRKYSTSQLDQDDIEQMLYAIDHAIDQRPHHPGDTDDDLPHGKRRPRCAACRQRPRRRRRRNSRPSGTACSATPTKPGSCAAPRRRRWPRRLR